MLYSTATEVPKPTAILTGQVKANDREMVSRDILASNKKKRPEGRSPEANLVNAAKNSEERD